MIENLSITSGMLDAENKFQISFSWNWVVPTDGQPDPNCWVLCHALSEEEVLAASCFQSSEILQWYSTKYLPLNSGENKKFLTEAERLGQLKPGDMKLEFFPMRGNIQHHHHVEFDAEYSAKVFVITIFSEAEAGKKSLVFSRPYSEIKWEVREPKEAGFFKKLLGRDRDESPVLVIHSRDSRRKVLICRKNGCDTYSIIPGRAEELYLPEGLTQSSIEIAYLSSLISSNEF